MYTILTVCRADVSHERKLCTAVEQGIYSSNPVVSCLKKALINGSSREHHNYREVVKPRRTNVLCRFSLLTSASCVQGS